MPRRLFLIAVLLGCTPLSAVVTVGPERPLTSSVPAPVTAVDPRIASNGAGYLVAWSGGVSTFVLPLARDGSRLVPRAVAIDPPSSSHKRVADVATDGADYVVVTISPDGVTTTALSVDSAPHVVAQTRVADPPSPPNDDQRAWIAFGGDRYLLVYTRHPAVLGVFLDRRGAPISPPFVIEENQTSPAVSVGSNGETFLIAERGVTGPTSTIAISKDGTVMSRHAFADDRMEVNLARRALIFTGRKYVFVWSEEVGDQWSIKAAPLTATGVPERDVTLLAASPTGSPSLARAAVATSTGAVVFIEHAWQMTAVRIDADGEAIDDQPSVVIAQPSRLFSAIFDAAWNGSSLFGVWSRITNVSLFSGTLDISHVTSGAYLAEADPAEGIVAVAAAGHVQLLVWSELGSLHATRLFDGSPAGEALSLSDGPRQGTAAVASDGTDFLVVWQEILDLSPGLNVRMRIIRRDGASPVVPIASGSFDAPFVIWTGSEYLVTWTRPLLTREGAPDQELMALRVGRSGELLETEPRHITAGSNFTTGYARIAKTDHGLVAVFQHGTPTLYRYASPFMKYDIFAAPISAAGEFTDAPVALTNDPDHSIVITDFAASPGGALAIAWKSIPLDYHDRTTTAAAVFDAGYQPLRTFDFAPAFCWSGGSFSASWASDQVYVGRYSADGREAMLPIAMTSGADPKASPHPVAIENGALLTYTRPLPKMSGADSPRIVGRTILDVPRRRAVRQR